MEGTWTGYGGGVEEALRGHGGAPEAARHPTPSSRVCVRPQSRPQAAGPWGEQARRCAGTRAQARQRAPLRSHSNTSGTPACGWGQSKAGWRGGHPGAKKKPSKWGFLRTSACSAATRPSQASASGSSAAQAWRGGPAAAAEARCCRRCRRAARSSASSRVLGCWACSTGRAALGRGRGDAHPPGLPPKCPPSPPK